MGTILRCTRLAVSPADNDGLGAAQLALNANIALTQQWINNKQGEKIIFDVAEAVKDLESQSKIKLTDNNVSFAINYDSERDAEAAKNTILDKLGKTLSRHIPETFHTPEPTTQPSSIVEGDTSSKKRMLACGPVSTRDNDDGTAAIAHIRTQAGWVGTEEGRDALGILFDKPSDNSKFDGATLDYESPDSFRITFETNNYDEAKAIASQLRKNIQVAAPDMAISQTNKPSREM